jgi:hypothetical protein
MLLLEDPAAPISAIAVTRSPVRGLAVSKTLVMELTGRIQ